ncbi:MAG: hypothetical protein ACR2PK_04225 [Acidimicrobiales bacterium]
MQPESAVKDRLDLPEHQHGFDEAALEKAILESRRRQLAELAQLNN